jgi:hypothetical protein
VKKSLCKIGLKPARKWMYGLIVLTGRVQGIGKEYGKQNIANLRRFLRGSIGFKK